VFGSRHIHRSAIACGVAFALAVPGTAVAQQDLRSPDARDAAIAQERVAPARDVSSPQVITDRQHAIVERYKQSPAYQAALREVMVAAAPQPAPVHADSGLDWGAAGIGAAGMLAVMLIALAAVFTVGHRRQRLAAH
jgi:hypothetical protein